MAKSESVVIPFPKPASPASVDRPAPNAPPADANRAMLNELILQFCRRQIQGRNGDD